MYQDKLTKDFKLFSKDMGLSSLTVEDVLKKNIITPYILEERINNTSTLDIYSRLLFDRILYFGSAVTEETCNVAIAQLLFLDSVNENRINIYINSTGGSVIHGLGLIDTMNIMKSPISTTCVGMAASMGILIAP